MSDCFLFFSGAFQESIQSSRDIEPQTRPPIGQMPRWPAVHTSHHRNSTQVSAVMIGRVSVMSGVLSWPSQHLSNRRLVCGSLSQDD